MKNVREDQLEKIGRDRGLPCHHRDHASGLRGLGRGAVHINNRTMTMNLSIIDQSAITMSSREIAELCEKRHDNVIRDIKKMLDDLGLDAHKFEGISPDSYGREAPSFNLPQILTFTLTSGYDLVLYIRVIDRWMELERQSPAISNFSDRAAAARAWADQFERNTAEAAKNECP